MERLHLEWMDLPGATDVMSFPMDQLRPGSAHSPVAAGTLGDVVLCPAVAQDQAKAAGHPLTDELCLLTTHGVLHLLGYDHHEAASRTEMFTLQKRLLEEFLGRSPLCPPRPTPPKPTPGVSDDHHAADQRGGGASAAPGLSARHGGGGLSAPEPQRGGGDS